MVARAEAAHEAGRKGVLLTKRWLESTTHMELPFDAYDWTSECSISCLDGTVKTFDLKGWLFRTKAPIFVENKNYGTVGNQPTEFPDFLRTAYSATLAEMNRVKTDPRWEFMWVTTHPFSQTKWAKLTKRKQLRSALKDDPSVLGGASIDEDMVSIVAERIWLLVLSPRQDELTLSPPELASVEKVLNRKGKQ